MMKTFVSGSLILGHAHVPTYHEMRRALEAELRRARRYERALAMVILTLDPPPAAVRDGDASAEVPRRQTGRARSAADPDRGLDAQLSFLLLGALLQDTLRETDIVTYAAQAHAYVGCLPECSAEAARRTVHRVGAVLGERTSWALRAGVSAYPSDGLTLEDLLAHAQRDVTAGPLGRLAVLREASAS